MILILKRYIQTTVLTFILVTATAVHAAAQENDTEMIAAVEGADMAIYSLYCDEASRDDRHEICRDIPVRGRHVRYKRDTGKNEL